MNKIIKLAKNPIFQLAFNGFGLRWNVANLVRGIKKKKKPDIILSSICGIMYFIGIWITGNKLQNKINRETTIEERQTIKKEM